MLKDYIKSYISYTGELKKLGSAVGNLLNEQYLNNVINSKYVNVLPVQNRIVVL